MKRFLLCCAAVMIAALSFDSVSAQTTAKEQRQQARGLKVKDRKLDAQIREKALVEARQEAKKLTKDGFKAAAGALPLDKQIEQSWKYQYETDVDGNRLYIVAMATSTSGSYNAAKTQAMALAKVELAGQIATEVAELIENQVSTEDLGAGEAATLVSTVSASKLKIQQNIGKVIPVVEISRTLSNKNVEMQVTIAYNTKNALTIVKQAVKEDLKTKGGKLAQELDTILK